MTLSRTTTQLLEGLVDPANERIWQDFDARFRPILIAFGRRLGLSPDDAADAAQETLTRFVKAYRDGRYDRSRGRLSSWIIGIARNCIVDLHSMRAARPELRGISAIDAVPGPDDLATIWDAECEQAILSRGMEQLRNETKTDDKTIRAFEMIAFEGHKAGEVAEVMGLSLNDVYLAKHRCLKRLRDIVAKLNELYEVA